MELSLISLRLENHLENGFPVTAMVVSEENGEALEKISASFKLWGNPMACAAALASIEVIEEEIFSRCSFRRRILHERMVSNEGTTSNHWRC